VIERILVAVDDSVPALAAATVAIELAGSLDAAVDVVTVVDSTHDPAVIHDHIRTRAERAGVPAQLSSRVAERPFEAVLAAADEYGDDLIVMGRTSRRSTGRPYVGSQTEHVLEFATVPVIVVPAVDRRRETSRG
jgi:nucleotide-binding universal stress UspA family protein